MSKKLLNRPNVVTAFQQVCRKTVAQNVASGMFRYVGSPGGCAHGFLYDAFMKMMPPLRICGPVEVPAGGGKYELPTPFGIGLRVLPRNRLGQLNPSSSLGKIFLVKGPGAA
jgi:hypothetical protein